MATDKCTLSNKELAERVKQWASSLAASRGESWALHIPVNFNQDPDMLMVEIANRLEAMPEATPTVLGSVQEWQLCPLCLGQGIVSRPEHIPADVSEWSSTSAVHVCHICRGAKMILKPIAGATSQPSPELTEVHKWIEKAVTEIGQVEGKVASVSKYGGSMVVRFENKHGYVVSIGKANQVHLDEAQPSPVPEDVKEIKVWPFNGFAPGKYMNACSICKVQMKNVDRLCFVCLECAIKGAQEILNKYLINPSDDIKKAAKEYADRSYPPRDPDSFESKIHYLTYLDKHQEITIHFLAGHAYKGQPSPVPLSIIEALEKMNPYEMYEESKTTSGASIAFQVHKNLISKLRELAGASPEIEDTDAIDVLCKQSPAPIPVDIVERLEKANPHDPMQLHYNALKDNEWHMCCDKLKEILSTNTDKEVKP